ncbi:hypothetical protein ONZ45_g2808 [Pleurotus djamor]|nr:hypothetical protein ONZ45_g2808 [Pleurotus djamor]
MYFTVDGGPEANFTQPALTSKPGRIFEVFQQTNLTPGDHTITIYNGPRDGKPAFDSIVMFLDAIVYTTNDKSLKIPVPSPSGQAFTSDAEAATTSAPITHTTSDVVPPTRSNANQSNSSSLSSQQIGIIVGGVCGGLVGLIATFLLFWLWRRRFQDSNYSPTAFDPRRFVRWPGSRPKAPSAQYSSDMEAMRPSQPSVNSLYMYPSPSYGQTSSAYGNDQKY